MNLSNHPFLARVVSLLAATLFLSSCGGGGDIESDSSSSTTSATEAPVNSLGKASILEERVINNRLIELTIATSSFAEPTQVLVNLPEGYTTQKAWPLTFYLAGTNHTYKSFNEIYGGEELVVDYPSIVVSPNGKSGYWSDWYSNGAERAPRYETYLIQELLPLIENRFSTIRLRQGRAILGESMGGYGALMIASRHPDLFAAAASVSGTVNTNLIPNATVLSASPVIDGAAPDSIYGPRATEEVRWRGHNPFDLAENLRTLALWVGTADGLVHDPSIGETAIDQAGCGVEFGVSTASISLHERLLELGVDHTWRHFGAGCHSVPNFRRQIKEVLAFFQQTFAAANPAPRKLDHRAVEATFSVWNWSIQAERSRPLEFLTFKDASASGLTLSGSGLTQVTSPPFFPGIDQIAVEGGIPAFVKPDTEGRIQFSVDLGAPNAEQQYRPTSSTQVKTVTVNFRPSTR